MAIVWTILRLPAKIIRINSLAARLILSAAVWSTVALAAGGFVLSQAFTAAVSDNFDATLSGDLDGMIAAAEPDANGLVALRERYLNARFARAYSGLYWEIVPDSAGSVVQTSHSLFDTTIKLIRPESKGKLVWGEAVGPEKQHLRVVSRHLSFSVATTPSPNDSRGYTFMVAADESTLDREVAEFNGTLVRSFVALLIGLLAAVFIQVRVGLSPLRRVGEALARIRSGAARRLEGTFPTEIQPLAAELNSLIAHSADVVSRARTHVSNLAHFLKTPLTVLATEAEASPGPLGDAVKKQVEVMRRQVDHYLARARAAGALDILGSRTPVAPVLYDLARVLSRIYEARGIEVEVDCPAGLSFGGERQDLEEMAGNLMDNACKWARTQVVVRGHGAGARLVVTVEDDGRGLTPEERARVQERGERLDESVPGSGLGLSIVRDIARLYGGGLELGEADMGGLQATLTLPATT